MTRSMNYLNSVVFALFHKLGCTRHAFKFLYVSNERKEGKSSLTPK